MTASALPSHDGVQDRDSLQVYIPRFSLCVKVEMTSVCTIAVCLHAMLARPTEGFRAFLTLCGRFGTNFH